MKIMICGKGGSGKSTLAALVARALSKKGYRVLLIDGDESNMGLHRLLGGAAPVNYMDSLGGKKGFREKRNATSPVKGRDDIFAPNTKFDDIRQICISEANGIKLLSIGKINTPGEGCACPMGQLAKTILSNLSIGPDEIAIIDAAAGIEHFGRGIDVACDLILCIVDPTFESFLLADKMAEMAAEIQKELLVVFNKVNKKAEAIMDRKMDPEKVIARVPEHKEIYFAGLEGKQIALDSSEIEKICDAVDKRKKNLSSSQTTFILT